MGTRGQAVAVIAVVVLAALSACADGGGGDSLNEPLPTLSAAEQEYADSFERKWLDRNEGAPEGGDDRITKRQARCLSARFIDRMGIDRLERYIPHEILGEEDDQWGDADIRLEDEEVDWLLQIEERCGIDETSLIAAGIAGDDQQLRGCLEEQFDTAVGRRMHELQWGGTETEYEKVATDFFSMVKDACGDPAGD